MTTSKSARHGGISHTQIAHVLSSPTRWSLLAALVRDEVLPAAALAKKVRLTASNLSKHLAVLRRSGAVEYWHGKLYRIPQRFRVSGQMALDFGSAMIRLDGVE